MIVITCTLGHSLSRKLGLPNIFYDVHLYSELMIYDISSI